MKSVSGTTVIPEFHDYALDVDANVVHTTYFGTGDATSPRWRKTFTNGLGQVVREESPGPNGNPIIVLHEYDHVGSRIKTSRTETADQLFVYDGWGRLTHQGVDVDNNGSLDKISTDVVTQVENYYEKDGSNMWWQVNFSRHFLTDNNDSDWAISMTRRKLGSGAGFVVESTGRDGIKQFQQPR